MFKRIILIKYIVLMSSVFGVNNSSSLTLNGFSSSGSEQAIRFFFFLIQVIIFLIKQLMGSNI